MNGWLIAAGWPVMMLAMLAAWWWQYRTRNASIVDVVWTLGTGLLAVVFAFLADGLPARRWLVGSLAAFWSLRLALHLLPRLRHAEDRRYQALRRQWGSAADLRFFFFFQSQALASPLFAATMLVAASAPGPFSFWDVLGFAVGVLAIAGEWLADHQLASFRADPKNHGQVCDVGLWRYSRHPNYFCEWLHWWSYLLLAASSSWWWLTIPAPLAMFYFLNYVTGVPAAEAQSLESRGARYQDYQRRTSRFFPWPPMK